MKRLFTAIAALGISGVMASAQDIDIKIDKNDPITHLTPEKWILLMASELDLTGLKKIDGVLIANPFNDTINSVQCGGYELITTDPYKSVRGNPAELKPFRVSFLKTKDFDTYCSTGMEASGSQGSYYIDIPGGSLSNATLLFIRKKS